MPLKYTQTQEKILSAPETKEGYVRDYITNQYVRATPEEIEAVQVFLKQLVEDYDYRKTQIQTHPQWRVKIRPSDIKKEYPIDIAVFESDRKVDDNLYIIVECKQKTRKEGIDQLKDYLRFCTANLGVWFNGEERVFLRKLEHHGKIIFEEIPNIPKRGQRVEDIGKFKRKDLQPTHNLKAIFKSIRNYLAANTVGTTRDEELAKQIINIVLCKLYDEKFTKPEEVVSFRAGVAESPSDIAKRVKERFNEAKDVYKDILDRDDRIELDDKSIAYIVGELQNYSLIAAERDAVGDAFEVFVQRALKGGQGQFFTPKNVVKTVIDILDPQIDEKVIDPACGSGGFLVECLRHIHKKIDEKGKEYGWPKSEIEAEKIAKVNINLKGIEKDKFLSRIVKAYMVILGDGKGGIFCEDSLDSPSNWEDKTQGSIQLGTFDIVVTNPPFGAKIPVKGAEKLSQYPLGHKWKKDEQGTWTSGKVKDGEAPQILFIDRCLALLKEGGRLGIVLPDGILSNPTDAYIMQYLLERAEIIGIIDLPMTTFLPYTPTKTHLLFLRKKKPRANYSFFMSYVKTCGHDKRGREINNDEIKLVPEHIKSLNGSRKKSHLGFLMDVQELENKILLPKYYNPELEKELKKYAGTGKYSIKSIGELVRDKILSIKRGNEVGSEYYGTGTIPFIRTSEISNWEVAADPTHCIPEEIYELYRARQDIKPEDIIIVNDGTYLMGRAAMITDIDIKITIQSHFRKIRVLKKEVLSPYLLLAILGLEIVQKQIEAKSFRQGTISTLGSRLLEVKVPLPKNHKETKAIIDMVKKSIYDKRGAKLSAQTYLINGKMENLMGIRNKAKIGNL